MRNSDKKELVWLSRRSARHFDWVQATGGNTSVKSSKTNTLHIKASGYSLSEITPTRGLVSLNLKKLNMLHMAAHRFKGSPVQRHNQFIRQLNRSKLNSGTIRPSLETGVHIPLGRVVLHIHPIYINAITCMKGGQKIAAKLFPPSVLWVPYAAPGLNLAIKLESRLAEYRKVYPENPAIVIFENHGLVVSGQSAKWVYEKTKTAISACKRFFGPLPKKWFAYKRISLMTRQENHLIKLIKDKFSTRPVVARLPKRRGLIEVLKGHPSMRKVLFLIPDDVVFGGHVKIFSHQNHMSRWMKIQKSAIFKNSHLFLINGCRPILIGPTEKSVAAMEDMLFAQLMTRILIRRKGQPRMLDRKDVGYLRNMESEKYRQSLLKKK